MQVYEFEARDARGCVVADAVEAASPEEALRKVRARGLFPVRLAESQPQVPVAAPVSASP